jgi:hypothetical protein
VDRSPRDEVAAPDLERVEERVSGEPSELVLAQVQGGGGSARGPHPPRPRVESVLPNLRDDEEHEAGETFGADGRRGAGAAARPDDLLAGQPGLASPRVERPQVAPVGAYRRGRQVLGGQPRLDSVVGGREEVRDVAQVDPDDVATDLQQSV